jgi:hypothetical protein
VSPVTASARESVWLDGEWRARALAWAAAALAEHGLAITGEPEQPHVTLWSTALRIPVGDGAYWLKANCPANRYEAALAAALGRWVPADVVVPLAVDPGEGWLLSPDAGPTVRAELAARAEAARDAVPDGSGDGPGGSRGGPAVDFWVRSLGQFAALQRAVEGHSGALIDAGVPDQRPSRLPAVLARLLDQPADLMLGQEGGMTAAQHRRLCDLQPEFADWCAELDGFHVSASVQHDDLHDANILVRDGRYRFFDWGDACIGHPFGVLLVALRVAEHRNGIAAHSPELHQIRDAYLEAWRGDLSLPELRRASDLAIRTGKVCRAASYERALAAVPHDRRGSYGEAIGGWLAELLEPDVI